MAVRLKDVAEDLGVSQMTVSKVLRGKKDIGEETRRRVLQRAQELGYQPNMAARALVKGRTYAVALVVPDLVHPFFAEVARSLAAELRLERYALILASSEDSPEIERHEIEALTQRGVDVMIVASCSTGTEDLAEMRGLTTPLLLLDRRLPRMKAPFVGVDDVAVGRLASQHLLDTGCRRMAHIAGVGTSPSRDRERGFCETLRRAGHPVPERWVLRREGTEQHGEAVGREATELLLKGKHRPEAIFCYNDVTAIGAMQAALAAGLRVPEDLAIVGCGNNRYAGLLQIPLTSIDQNTEELGRQAARIALNLCSGTGVSGITRLQPRLVQRASTRRLPQAR